MSASIKQETATRQLPPEKHDEESEEESEESGSSEDEFSSSDSSPESESEVSKREMSEREQFELHAKYRRLDRDLVNQRTEIARENGIKAVAKSLDLADHLFSETKTSIQSNIVAKDSATLKEIGLQAKLATKNLKLGRSQRVLDFNEFTNNFMKQFSGQEDIFEEESAIDRSMSRFNWIGVGLLFMNCSRRAPTTDFLLGPLENTRRSRVTKQRLADDSRTGVSKTANKRTASELMEQDQRDDTTANSERCFRRLRTLEGEKINLFKFFVDPNSFAKSVENLFYTSFLINHGKVILGKDSAGIPFVQEANATNFKELPRFIKKDDSKSHIIFNLDHETWKHVVETFDIHKAFL
ncbi:hypothetical protein OGAPHI_001732 [Ogataea philodendri]|uniref:Non-structural maintenance of chromosomes element 4 n=1 Tax=Ogataea philodendri TaxID=1378263 RepID=A0A9P8P9C0_9ASCO|nr:uncharacterized protein OGAPHI_001732 [Ogataea philodendri]KAH3667978.1 hypothetical protein OGAPHI_001732 [Ogataea philodendri]